MTQEDKVFLLKDLCARLPYGVICHYNCAIRCDTMEINKSNCVGKLEGIIPFNGHIGFMVGGDKVNALFHDIKPYLRPMSSMTAEEICKIESIIGEGFSYKNGILTLNTEEVIRIPIYKMSNLLRFIYQRHLDFNNLIPKGLAIEVTKENNPYEDINL